MKPSGTPGAAPPRHPTFVRYQTVQRSRRRLAHSGWPRLQMALISMLTGGVGLLASFAMLQLGLLSMAARYPLALLVAWVAFLMMVGVWLRARSADALNGLDLPDLTSGLYGRDAAPPTGEGSAVFDAGGGGDFVGGGASGAFDGPAANHPLAGRDMGMVDAAPEDVAHSLGEAVGAAAEGEELAVPLLLLVLAAGMALASVYLVYTAPAFLAEVAVDGALSVGFYRWLRGDHTEHWLPTAVRRSALPFLATAVFLAAVGAGLSAYAPGAHSMGDVLRRSSAAR